MPVHCMITATMCTQTAVHTLHVVAHCYHREAITRTIHYYPNVPNGVHQHLLPLPFLWFWLAIFLAASIEPAHFICWSWQHLPECNSVPLEMKTSMFLHNSDINTKDCHLIVTFHKRWQYRLNKFRSMSFKYSWPQHLLNHRKRKHSDEM